MKLFRLIVTGLSGLLLSAAFLHAQPADRGRVSLSVSGAFVFSGLGYDYRYTLPYYYQTLTIADTLGGGRKGRPGLNASVGYFFSKKLEAFIGLSAGKAGSQEGRVSVSVPSQVYLHEIATGTDLRGRKSSAVDLFMGARFHPAPASKVDPYLGFGGCLSAASLQLLAAAFYTDTYTQGMFHDVEITRVDFETMKAHALGGFVTGGLAIGLGPRLAVCIEGIYRFARKSVLHPFSSAIGSPQDVRVDLSGFAASLGLRVRL